MICTLNPLFVLFSPLVTPLWSPIRYQLSLVIHLINELELLSPSNSQLSSASSLQPSVAVNHTTVLHVVVVNADEVTLPVRPRPLRSHACPRRRADRTDTRNKVNIQLICAPGLTHCRGRHADRGRHRVNWCFS